MSAFWSSTDLEPNRKYRFKVEIGGLGGHAGAPAQTGGAYVWYAKGVNLPSFEISQGEYQLGNHKLKYPGILTWNDVTLTIVDPKNKAVEFLKNFVVGAGYSNPEATGMLKGGGDIGISKEKAGSTLGYVKIYTLDHEGDKIETYELNNPWVKSMNLGELSYDSDDLLEIQVVFAYDYADIQQ